MNVERRPADLKSDRPSILRVDVDVVLSQRARFRCDVYFLVTECRFLASPTLGPPDGRMRGD
jgi:hypothetical protein